MVRQFNRKCLRILVFHLFLLDIAKSKKCQRIDEDRCLLRNRIASTTVGKGYNLNSFVLNEWKFLQSNLSLMPSTIEDLQSSCSMRSQSSVNNRLESDSHIIKLNPIGTTNNCDNQCEGRLIQEETAKQEYESLGPNKRGKRVTNKARRLLQVETLGIMSSSLEPNAIVRNVRGDEYRKLKEVESKKRKKRQFGDNEVRGICHRQSYRAIKSIGEISELTEKLLLKVSQLHNYLTLGKDGEDRKRERGRNWQKYLISRRGSPIPGFLSDLQLEKRNGSRGKMLEKSVSAKRRTRKSNEMGRIDRRRKRRSRRKWDRWTDWSSCSVTCGKGRQIRWRYCIRDCGTAESEMEAKDCQLPACAPSKFLGIF